MKRKSSRSGFLNLHVLIALVVFLTGVYIALFATAAPWEAASQDAQGRNPNGSPFAPSDTVHQAWVRRYNGPGNGQDVAKAMAVDPSGNVFVTGASSGSGTDLDYATIKYNSAGQRQWLARYNGPGNGVDVPFAIALDASDNVYVTGSSIGSDIHGDYATIKYNSAGQQQWVARYDGPGHGDDYAAAIAVDSSGNVYVTGQSQSDYVTIKYNSAGQEQWVARYNGPLSGSDDVAEAITVDGSGNVYVTGGSWGSGSFYDYATVKYNSAGQQRWVARYDGGAGGFDAAFAIAVDGSGDVYVAGRSDGPDTGSDYATIKYNAAGQREWVARYAGPGNATDYATAMALDTAGNVYVTGGTSDGYATIKYNPAGQQQWVEFYQGGYATAIAGDASGNVYVTGSSGYDYTTIKYNGVGQQEWVARYNGPVSGSNQAGPIAIDHSGNVYVTGYSGGLGTDSDYATIKYVQEAGPAPTPTSTPTPTRTPTPTSTPTPTPTPTVWPSITPRPLPTFPPRPTYPPRPTRPPR